MRVIIVGAGMAGLTCARALQRAGVQTTVLEASDGIGGRVRTDIVAGYRLDRGFQVLFDAYPAVRRWLDYDALQLRAFDPGAVVVRDGKRSILTDPLRDWRSAWPALWADNVSTIDKLRILALRLQVQRTPFATVQAQPDQTTRAYLEQYGFGAQTIEQFFAPFYGGIFLDRSLQTSAKCFVYDFKMLAEGRTVVPAAGMGALATQLAQGVEVECRQSVSRLCITAGRVSGVVLADGTERYADAVVLAVPAPIAQQLSGLDIPTTPKSTVTLYWAGSQALTTQKKLWLNANPDAYVNNAMQMTAVAPEYGPVGGHLLSATVIGAPAEDDAQCYTRAEHDLEELTGQPALLSTYRRLRLYRIPYAQFAQPAGIHATLPGSQTALAGLYLAGEYTIASSINAAMLSGERAARAVTRSTSGGV
jgi:phytoene dehydrogenase-like protein